VVAGVCRWGYPPGFLEDAAEADGGLIGAIPAVGTFK